MTDPSSGPFLFDTSADSYLARTRQAAERNWVQSYLALFPLQVSVITVIERLRGYALLLKRIDHLRRPQVEAEKALYLRGLEAGLARVIPVTLNAGLIAAQLLVLCPAPPSPPRRTHQLVESRQERLSRWRFDVLIAATALAIPTPLVHHNPADFEYLRGAIENAPERFPGTGPLDLISVKRLL